MAHPQNHIEDPNQAHDGRNVGAFAYLAQFLVQRALVRGKLVMQPKPNVIGLAEETGDYLVIDRNEVWTLTSQKLSGSHVPVAGRRLQAVCFAEAFE